MEKNTYPVTLSAGRGYTVYGQTQAVHGEPYRFTLALEDGYQAKGLIVKVNGQTLTPQSAYQYTFAPVDGPLKIEISGVRKIPPASPLTGDGALPLWYALGLGALIAALVLAFLRLGYCRGH